MACNDGAVLRTVTSVKLGWDSSARGRTGGLSSSGTGTLWGKWSLQELPTELLLLGALYTLVTNRVIGGTFKVTS